MRIVKGLVKVEVDIYQEEKEEENTSYKANILNRLLEIISPEDFYRRTNPVEERPKKSICKKLQKEIMIFLI